MTLKLVFEETLEVWQVNDSVLNGSKTAQLCLNFGFQLELTDELERLLIYDQEKILGEKSLHRIPAQFTVEDILNQVSVFSSFNLLPSAIIFWQLTVFQYLDHLVKYANRQETDSSFDNDIKLAKECVDGIKV